MASPLCGGLICSGDCFCVDLSGLVCGAYRTGSGGEGGPMTEGDTGVHPSGEEEYESGEAKGYCG